MDRLFGRQQTPEEIKEIRQQRNSYQDYLSGIQTKTVADVNTKQLTPESGQAILKKIQEGQTWLEKHPNANFNELTTSQDAVTAEISKLLKTDKPKRALYNVILTLPILAEQYQQSKTITSEQAEQLKAFATTEEKWYKKYADTATDIDFSQEELKIRDQIQTVLVQEKLIKEWFEALDNMKQKDIGQLKADIATYEEKQQLVKETTVDIQEGASTGLSTGVKWFLGIMLVFFFLYCGSLAANFAIGRPPIYRVLNFCYGAFPLFSPFVLFYAIYRRIRYGPFPYYAVLPVRTEMMPGKIGEWLYNPFFTWTPNYESVQAVKEYTQSLSQAVT